MFSVRWMSHVIDIKCLPPRTEQGMKVFWLYFSSVGYRSVQHGYRNRDSNLEGMLCSIVVCENAWSTESRVYKGAHRCWIHDKGSSNRDEVKGVKYICKLGFAFNGVITATFGKHLPRTQKIQFYRWYLQGVSQFKSVELGTKNDAQYIYRNHGNIEYFFECRL